MNKVLVVGRATIDFNPLDGGCTLDKSTTFKKYVGGSACNTAIGLKRQGIDTSLLTKVSTDQFGKFIYDYLEQEAINTKAIKFDENTKVGLTFTEMVSPEQSSILMYREKVSDLMLNIDDVKDSFVCEHDWVLISGTCMSSDDSRLAILKIADLCKENNIPIIFDLDYRPYTWNSMNEIELCYSMLSKSAQIIVGSLEEYKLMSSICLNRNKQQIAQYFLNKSAEHVVIKDGKNGSNYYSDKGNYKVEIFPVEVKKSFGGGDAYISTLIAGILNNEPISNVLFKATAHAAMLVNSHSCSEALSSTKAIMEYIKDSNIEKKTVIKESSENNRE
ncbi:MAG: 5-dehydro-2-deoxygluconokinase [Erysipelotrichaceae bacterium]